MASPCTSITDERLAVLLEEIFLKLPTAADLACASAACVPFRQVATGGSFLRRFRRSHPPPFVGFMDWHGFRPALPPDTSARAADAIVSAADFTFSFLPSPTRYSLLPDPGLWSVRSILDGRVLLDRGPKCDNGPIVFPLLVVCDPLHRQYRLIPPIPKDLTASVKDPLELTYKRSCEVILVPPGNEVAEEKEEYETSFRVIWFSQCKAKLVAFVYSSNTGQWQSIASKGWSDLLPGVPTTVPSSYSLFGQSHYAYGCLYWPMKGRECGLQDYPREVMLVLDTMTMEFSVADYPPGRWRNRQIGIVEAGDGRLGLLTFSEDSSELHFTVRGKAGQTSNDWHLEKIIPLGKGDHVIIRATQRYLLLRRSDMMMNFRTLKLKRLFEKSECFSLDVKTFQLERVCEKSDVTCGPIYTNFPPSLSSRTV
jgi:hypothetical protein